MSNPTQLPFLKYFPVRQNNFCSLQLQSYQKEQVKETFWGGWIKILTVCIFSTLSISLVLGLVPGTSVMFSCVSVFPCSRTVVCDGNCIFGFAWWKRYFSYFWIFTLHCLSTLLINIAFQIIIIVSRIRWIRCFVAPKRREM